MDGDKRKTPTLLGLLDIVGALLEVMEASSV
jgi:hypothetical protein